MRVKITGEAQPITVVLIKGKAENSTPAELSAAYETTMDFH
jgi:hypothetical protein